MHRWTLLVVLLVVAALTLSWNSWYLSRTLDQVPRRQDNDVLGRQLQKAQPFIPDGFRVYVPELEELGEIRRCLDRIRSLEFKQRREDWLQGHGSYFLNGVLHHEMLLQSRFRTKNLAEASAFFIPLFIDFDTRKFCRDVGIEQAVAEWAKSSAAVSKGMFHFVVSPHCYDFWAAYGLEKDVPVWCFSNYARRHGGKVSARYTTIPPNPVPAILLEWKKASKIGISMTSSKNIDFFFLGSTRDHPVRKGLLKLFIDYKDTIGGKSIVSHGFQQGEVKAAFGEKNLYHKLMISSKFCFAPRGDDPFCQHFTNAIAAGCIPIIISDSYQLYDFGPELPYHEFTIRLSERQFAQADNHLATANMLRSLLANTNKHQSMLQSLLQYRNHFIVGYGIPGENFQANIEYEQTFLAGVARAVQKLKFDV